MKNLIIGILTATALSPALSIAGSTYVDGTYRCKNSRGLPENSYSIRTVTIGEAKVPFVEATRYFRRDPSKPESPVDSATVSGFAAVSSTNFSAMLMVAALKLEFVGEKLVGCE